MARVIPMLRATAFLIALAAVARADAPKPIKVTARNFGPWKFNHVLTRAALKKIFPKATVEEAEPSCAVMSGRKVCTSHWAVRIRDDAGLAAIATNFDIT